MANNPLLYNAALSAAVGGAINSRWITSQNANDYTVVRNAAIQFAQTVDAAIPINPEINTANADLLGSICRAVLNDRSFTAEMDSSGIAQSIVALYNEVSTGLDANPISAGDIRYSVLADDSGISGVIQSYQPTNLDSHTQDIRAVLGGNALVLGMPLADGQQICLRLSRTVPANLSLILAHEDSGAITDSERFNNPNNQPVVIRRGEGVLIHKTGNRNNVQVLGQNTSRLIQQNNGTVSATNSTTELSCGGVLSFLANALAPQQIFYFESHFEFIHTATSVPIIDVGFAVNGVATYHPITPINVNGIYSGAIFAMARVASIGVGGIWRTTTQWKNSFGSNAQNQVGGASVIPSVNTTLANTLEFRMRMQTAEPGNTLSVFNSIVQSL